MRIWRDWLAIIADKGLDRLVGQPAASIPSTARHLIYCTLHIGRRIRSHFPFGNQSDFVAICHDKSTSAWCLSSVSRYFPAAREDSNYSAYQSRLIQAQDTRIPLAAFRKPQTASQFHAKVLDVTRIRSSKQTRGSCKHESRLSPIRPRSRAHPRKHPKSRTYPPVHRHSSRPSLARPPRTRLLWVQLPIAGGDPTLPRAYHIRHLNPMGAESSKTLQLPRHSRLPRNHHTSHQSRGQSNAVQFHRHCIARWRNTKQLPEILPLLHRRDMGI